MAPGSYQSYTALTQGGVDAVIEEGCEGIAN